LAFLRRCFCLREYNDAILSRSLIKLQRNCEKRNGYRRRRRAISTATSKRGSQRLLMHFQWADYDAYQTNSNVLALGGSVIENKTIYGTVTYRATMTSGEVIASGTVDCNKVVVNQRCCSRPTGSYRRYDGNTISNRDATGALTVTLPSAVVTGDALRYIIIDVNDMAGRDINVIPQATDYFTDPNGTMMGAGERLLMTDDEHAGISIQCYDVGIWTLKGSFGLLRRKRRKDEIFNNTTIVMLSSFC